MTRENIMVNLFNFSAPTYYRWSKHEKRKIFDLLEYAFNDKELEEYLNTNKIKRIEKEKSYQILSDAAIDFFKKLSNSTQFRIATNTIILLEENFRINNSNLQLDKFIEEIYLKDENFFYPKKENVDYFEKKTLSSIKFTLVKLFQNVHPSVLDYICRNIEEIKEKTKQYANKNLFDDEMLLSDIEINIF